MIVIFIHGIRHYFTLFLAAPTVQGTPYWLPAWGEDPYLDPKFNPEWN